MTTSTIAETELRLLCLQCVQGTERVDVNGGRRQAARARPMSQVLAAAGRLRERLTLGGELDAADALVLGRALEALGWVGMFDPLVRLEHADMARELLAFVRGNG